MLTVSAAVADKGTLGGCSVGPPLGGVRSVRVGCVGPSLGVLFLLDGLSPGTCSVGVCLVGVAWAGECFRRMGACCFWSCGVCPVGKP